ncbi:MAG: hypothetical protein JWL89_628 [Candidatus Saccharibacteria bacterium]|nr:hypothetical protein [Candidatus Saccharibacteria bacterium]
MVTKHEVEQQLKKLKFNHHGWGRSEVNELHNIILPDEEISEVVNGMYEGGFALLVASNIRVLLIDKKPMNYLTVEDLRFDMINEIDYSHRLIGARISISTGSKNLRFTSYNQPRLRKLITHVQHCMADTKQKQSQHEEGQNQHLEQINQQLQAYLIAQHQQQQQMQQKLEEQLKQTAAADDARRNDVQIPEPVKPSPELSDFLYAQSLLAQHKAAVPSQLATTPSAQASPEPAKVASSLPETTSNNSQMAELYADGMQEIFGKHQAPPPSPESATPAASAQQPVSQGSWSTRGHRLPAILPILPSLHLPNITAHNPLEPNAINIAYSKLPMALRNRKFGRPSLHAHSKAQPSLPSQTTPASAGQ